jgi:hypothetical protein
MKYLNACIVGVFLAVIFGCVAPDKPVYHDVTYDYDVNTDFSQIKSYNWEAMPGTLRIGPFDQIRIKDAVNTQMDAKGLKIVPDKPDVFLVMYGGNYKAVDMSVMMDYAVYNVGRIKLAMYDAESNLEIWWGEARADLFQTMTPAERDQVVATAVRKIFDYYPPRP